MPTYLKWKDEISEEVWKKAEKELGETPETRKRCLKEIRDLIDREDGFRPVMEDWNLIIFLRNKKFNVKKAFKTLKNYYEFKSLYSGSITDLKPSKLKKILEMKSFIISPLRNLNGEAVMTFFIDAFDIDTLTVYDHLAAVFAASEIAILQVVTQICGCALIFDIKDVTFKKLMQFATPTFLTMLVRCLQDRWPYRVNSIHIIHQPYYFDVFFNILKLLLSKKLKERVFFHGDNLNTLYASIPQDILPKKIGGYLPEEIYDEFHSHLYDNESILDVLIKYTYNRVSYGETIPNSDNL